MQQLVRVLVRRDEQVLDLQAQVKGIAAGANLDELGMPKPPTMMTTTTQMKRHGGKSPPSQQSPACTSRDHTPWKNFERTGPRRQ